MTDKETIGISIYVILYCIIFILLPLFRIKKSDVSTLREEKRRATASLGGLFISLGGVAYLNNVNDNKILAAFLFSIGLVAVILLGADLFTGKIGYVTKDKWAWTHIIYILYENLFAAVMLGLLYGKFKYNNPEVIMELVEKKLNLSILELFFKSVGCGICILLAVELYKRTKSIFVIILSVMVFILAGFEHCIADVFYFASYLAVKEQSFLEILKNTGYILIIILGNSLGSIVTNTLIKLKEVKTDADEE